MALCNYLKFVDIPWITTDGLKREPSLEN